MNHNVMELFVEDGVDTPSNGQSANTLLVRLQEEAERAVATQRRPSPPVRQTTSAEKTVRVRYNYD